jgi:hypothetical protein
VFSKKLVVNDRPRRRPVGTAKGYGEVATSTAAVSPFRITPYYLYTKVLCFSKKYRGITSAPAPHEQGWRKGGDNSRKKGSFSRAIIISLQSER